MGKNHSWLGGFGVLFTLILLSPWAQVEYGNLTYLLRNSCKTDPDIEPKWATPKSYRWILIYVLYYHTPRPSSRRFCLIVWNTLVISETGMVQRANKVVVITLLTLLNVVSVMNNIYPWPPLLCIKIFLFFLWFLQPRPVMYFCFWLPISHVKKTSVPFVSNCMT